MAYNNKRGSSRGGKGKFAKSQGDFKMLQFGVTFLDEQEGKADFKSRIMLYAEDAKNQPCVKDENGNIVESYTREEAAELVAKALLAGRGITTYLFDNNDSWGGNARIDINGLEAKSSTRPARQAGPARKYDEQLDDTDEDELPY